MRLSIVSMLAALIPLAAASAADEDFMPRARQLRQAALARVSGAPIMQPSKGLALGPAQHPLLLGVTSFGRYRWHTGIVTTIFWCGEGAASAGGVSNARSAFDSNWLASFGGVDNPSPAMRQNYLPLAFVPRQSAFYAALPVADIQNGHTCPEASQWIPWFRSAFTRDGVSVCKGRWLAIRRDGRVCYARWEDVGPFRTDHWQYVFGNDRPTPNANRGAGLDVSPAVRDYLGLSGEDVTDWCFVSAPPPGPWLNFGESATLARR
jgi:hypothetical protein